MDNTVALALAEKTRLKVVLLSSNITTMCTDNVDYTTPNPALVDVVEARDNEVAATNLVSQLESQLAQARLDLAVKQGIHDGMLTSLSLYAMNVTNGDGAKLEGGGFPLKRARTPIGPLAAPLGLSATAGAAPGTSECKWKRKRGDRSFIAQCATSPNGPWITFYTGTKAACLATALASGTLYYFHVAAVGASGQSPWSDISEKRAP